MKSRPPRRPITLVIGYGNELRGDDAVGQRVATAVAQWALPGVSALAVHQLTPELAAELASAELAIFVDADQTLVGDAIRTQPIEPVGAASVSAHSADPRTLLALTHATYGVTPRAWWVGVAAQHFDYASELSPATWRAAAAALRWIRSQLAS